MSHLTTSAVLITDLDILRKAIEGMSFLRWNEGAREHDGQKTFRSYYCHEKTKDSGRVLDDQIKAIGTLEHSISINAGRGFEKSYEIGVVRKSNGEGWALVFDPYDVSAARRVGNQCETIMSAYAEETVRDFASRNGFILEQSTDADGNIVMVMTDNN